MLFYVISDPYPSSYQEISTRFDVIKEWVNDLKSKKKIVHIYQKVDKGSVILLDVESNEELQQILLRWLDVVGFPVKFQIIPVVVPKVLE